jgi:hypothetical protein
LRFPHQTSNSSKEKLFLPPASTRQADRDISHLITKFLPFCGENQNNAPSALFEIEMFSFSSIFRDYISLQAPCQIFADRPARLGEPISCSLASDVQIYFIYLTSYTVLLLLIFITFCVLNGIASYGQSKRMIKIDGFERSMLWEGRDVDIAISSKKIKIILPGNYSQRHVVYIRDINVFIFSISRNYLSFQGHSQIFVD